MCLPSMGLTTLYSAHQGFAHWTTLNLNEGLIKLIFCYWPNKSSTAHTAAARTSPYTRRSESNPNRSTSSESQLKSSRVSSYFDTFSFSLAN